MEAGDLQTLLQRLAVKPARDLETQSLEFKGWCRNETELTDKISETAVCLANSDGGLLVIGVKNNETGATAIEPCPHNAVSPDWVRKQIRDSTKPPVPCQVFRVGDILDSTGGTPVADVLVVEV